MRRFGSRWKARRTALWALAAAGAAAGSIATANAAGAPRGPGQDAHYFLLTATSRGEYKVDYGRDLQPGLTTAAGVDGTTTGSWSWQIRAVGRSVGNGPLRSAAAEFKGSATFTSNLFSYTVQMGEQDIDPLCEGKAPGRIFTRQSPSRSGSTRPQWISRRRSSTSIDYRSGGFEITYPYALSPTAYHCFHGVPEGLTLHTTTDPADTPVPRGAFNPRSDRSFSKSWSNPLVNRSREEHGDHSESGSIRLSVTVKSVSEAKARRMGDSYRKRDPKPGVYRPKPG
jgi:hypothetical protein